MPPVAEHHIADNDQAPAVAQHLEREIDGATGSLGIAWLHVKSSRLEKPLAICIQVYYIGSACNMQAEPIGRLAYVQASRSLFFGIV